MITELLGWTKLPQWALELLVIAAVAGGIFYWQHHLIEKGINEQKAADAAASKKIEEDTAKQTAELKARATTAEQAYDKEHADNQNYRDSHPIGPVRLCANNASRPIVPAGGSVNPRNEGTGSATANVPEVPGRDNRSGAAEAGPDISGLLGLLAAKADDVSGRLREFQKR